MNTMNRVVSLRQLIRSASILGFWLLAMGLTAQTTSVTLQFSTDCWGSETSWTFNEDGGSTLASAPLGTYSDNLPDGSLAVETGVTLTIGSCYTLTVDDSFGDGFLGSQWPECNVDGVFNLIDENGNIFATINPDFTTTTSYSFCANFGCNNVGATNYDPNAAFDDGTCVFPEISVSFTSETIENGCGYRLVQFTNTSSVLGNSSWNFGNGTPSTSTDENPLVRFNTGTSQTVTLSVTAGAASASQSAVIDLPLNDESEPYFFEFDPDCYGSELSWNILDANDNVIYSAAQGTYTDILPTNPSVTTEVCLPAGCYSIVVFDSFGDGLSGAQYNGCDEDGTYRILDKFGNTIYQYTGTANFGFEITSNYCNTSEFVWTGAFSTSWTNTGNWAGNVAPNSTSANVRIQSTNYDPSLTTSINVKNVIIEENSTVNFGNSNGRLRVYGDFINKGTINPTAGRVEFRASTDQNIKAATAATTNFYELRLNKSNSVHLQSPISVKGFITLSSGYLELDGNLLTLSSDANYTGMIMQTSANSDIIGETIEMQRYFPAASGSWRMLCAPVSNSTFEQWNDDIPTTGFAGADYPNYPNAANPWSNIRAYNESAPGGVNEGFESISGVTEAIDPKKGYFTYFAPSPTLLDVQGDFPRGNVDYALTYNSNGSGANDIGWNLIANPYPCTVNWVASAGWTKTRLSNTIYAYDPINGQYSTYTNGVSVGSLTNLIGPFQAFWVKATSANPALTIRESAKSSSQGVFMREEDPNLNSLVRIKILTEQENVYDETVIGFHALAATGYDEEIEGFKLFSPNPALPSLATVPDSAEAFPMSIAMLPIPEEDLVVDLLFRPGQNTQLVLRNDMIDSFDSSMCFILEDRELGTFVPFNMNDEYPFEVTPETTENRFALRVSAPLQVSVLNETCPEAEDGRVIAEGYGQSPWTYVWENEMGEVIRTMEGMTTADSMEDLLPGFYTVTVSNANENCASSTEVVQVTAAAPMEVDYSTVTSLCIDSDSGAITVSPTSGYTWDIQLMNENAEVITTLNTINADSTITGLPASIYSLQATSSCGYTFVFNEVNLNNPDAVVSNFHPSSNIVLLSNGGSAFFHNESLNATSYAWDFGDGTTDLLSVNPQHIYQSEGDYVVKLTASNDDCTHVYETTIHVTGSASDLSNEDLALITDQETVSKINTTMTGTQMMFTPKMAIDTKVNVVVYNLVGQVVIDQKYSTLQANPYSIDLSALSTGYYTMNIASEDEILLTYEFIINQ